MTRAKKGLQKINYERRRECFVGLSPYWHMAEFLVNCNIILQLKKHFGHLEIILLIVLVIQKGSKRIYVKGTVAREFFLN